MKRLFLIAAAACMLTAVGCGPKKVTPVIQPDAQIEKNIDNLISKMTLDQKVGQMFQLEVSAVCDRSKAMQAMMDPTVDPIDDAKLRETLSKYPVGSMLNNPFGVGQPAAQWAITMKHIQDVAMEVIGIPILFGLDQNHGVTYTRDGVLFPQPLNMAATFNRELVRKGAEVTAYETRAGSVNWIFNPTLDLARDQRWPRMYEDFGEDCFVQAQMAREVVLGYQGDDPNHLGPDKCAASVKHYMGYGVPFTGKDRTPAIISESELREKHFAPYLSALEAGGLTIMVNSGSVNGLPVHMNARLLTQWLKEETGWDGMVVTDWADINNLYQRDRVAADKKEAIKLAINAGIDMSMDPYDTGFCDLLKELVQEGEVPMSRIDDAVRRILRVKYRLGLFDKPCNDIADFPEFASQEHKKMSLQAAEESMVLLKNDGILPLAKGKKILVCGPNANQMRCLDGGWSYTWQGDAADMFASDYNTLYEGLAQKYGEANVKYVAGVEYDPAGPYYAEKQPNIAAAAAAARGVDVVVCCIGENSYCETPGNLTDLNLSANQKELVKAVAKAGKPVILVLNEGRPRLITDIVDCASAVVDVIIPGNLGGDALANLIAGDANFSGRLPFTYPKEINSLCTYDYKPAEERDVMEGAYNYDAVVSVQWPFGYGLSYTKYSYSNLRVNTDHFTVGDELVFTVDVTNTGDVDGKESVLLFSSDLVASELTPDSRRLRAFEKVEIPAGQTVSVDLKVPAQDLAYCDYNGKWILEEGEFRIQTGSETVNVFCDKTYRWDTPNRR